MPTTYLFDFDGTLTSRDTLLQMVCRSHGRRALLRWMAANAPRLALMRLGLCSNGRAKERLFAHFYGGMAEAHFDALCRRFAADSRHLLRPAGMAAVAQAAASGARVAIVSASIDRWVAPFFDDVQPPVTIIATQIEVSDGRLTGRFATPNCHGPEKVRRVRQAMPDIATHHIIAYGDSRGDREMLAMAHEPHLRAF